jgi:amidophosphoribosyltransferase
MGKKEGCGIVGISLREGKGDVGVSTHIFYALYALQHRGQESAGMAVRKEGSKAIQLVKDTGFVYEVFNNEQLQSLKGSCGIGHVRYSTAGGLKAENAQPLVVNYEKGNIAIAHNGNLVNAASLRKELVREGRIFHSDADTEVIAHLLVKELMRHGYDLIVAIKELMQQLQGSYSLVILMDNTIIAVRDPLGFKPLCIGEIRGKENENKNKNGNGGTGYVIASESVAIDALDGVFIRDVRPGEVIVVSKSGRDLDFESYQLYRVKNTAHCVFEYIYFARPDSVLDGRLVYEVRKKIGGKLVDEHGVEADMVAPVPDSGVTFAMGYAKKANMDYVEGFIKNRYVGRTFIMPRQDLRDASVRLKLNVLRSNVVGKRIILVDDSIVRGTTSKRIVDYLKREGAKEVHVRIGSPPIKAPCYMGIDMPTREELMASRKNTDEICLMIHADSIGYLSIEGLIEAIGIAENNLCLGCLTGRYPIEIAGEECITRQMKLTQF